MELKLYQSIIGFNKVITHLDQRKLHVTYNKTIKDGDIKIIENEGMIDLNTEKKGDIQIIFSVKYPDLNKLSKEESDTFKVLLAKTEKRELEKETLIFKNKKSMVKTKLINLKEENYENNEHNEHNNNPSCVQQ